MSNYEQYVGHKVVKSRSNREPKKFKSGLKQNTVKSVIEHPILKVPAFTFEEDDSFVMCSMCRLVGESIEGKTTSLEHKKNCLNKAPNNEAKQTMIYDWCSTGQLLKQELWALINHCKMGISKNQLKYQYTGNEDPELILP